MSTDEKNLSRIRKCLALSESSNVHEAETALRQARALMSKMGVTDIDAARIQITESELLDSQTVQMAHWKKALAMTIGRVFGVKCWTVSRRRRTGRPRRMVQFYGVASRVELATHAWQVMSRVIASARRAYLTQRDESPWHGSDRASYKSLRVRLADDYALGFARACAGAVAPLVPSVAEKTAVALWMERKELAPFELPRSNRPINDSFHAGYKDGKDAEGLHIPASGIAPVKQLAGANE